MFVLRKRPRPKWIAALFLWRLILNFQLPVISFSTIKIAVPDPDSCKAARPGLRTELGLSSKIFHQEGADIWSSFVVGERKSSLIAETNSKAIIINIAEIRIISYEYISCDICRYSSELFQF